MIVITGGAYQGKLAYAYEHYGLCEEDVYTCQKEHSKIDPSKKILYHLELLIFAMLEEGTDPLEYFSENIQQFTNHIIICDDISCGVVPMEAKMRAWREAVGRTMTLLAKHSDCVVRLFCGIPTILLEKTNTTNE